MAGEIDFARHWPLDPRVTFLNHGSFGACPQPVLREQARLRRRMEREPITFLYREYEERLDAARRAAAAFVGCDVEDFVFVTDATAGVNAVLQSLRFSPGDELLVTDHEYNACRNVLDFVARRDSARVVVTAVPFPLPEPATLEEALLARVTPRTRLALIDHIASPTSLIFPVQRLAAEFSRRGVETLVDGAHGPGMVPLDLRRIGATYYTGNFHKWVSAPKGAAFLYVRRDRQESIRPPCISHGANSPRTDRSRFQLEFGWTGTQDPTPWLCVPAAIEFLGSLLPGGWPALYERNHRLILTSRRLLCQVLDVTPPCPDSLLGSMASLPLPDGPAAAPLPLPEGEDPLQAALFRQFRIETPVWSWPAPPRRVLRLSAHIYNRPEHYRELAEALRHLLPAAHRAARPPGSGKKFLTCPIKTSKMHNLR